MDTITRLTSSPVFTRWPKEYVWRCAICGCFAHGSRKFTERSKDEHTLETRHDIGFTRYPKLKFD